MKGWAININAEIRKQKQNLLKEFDILDIKQEASILSPVERDRMDNIIRDLEAIWNMEEVKARQI